MNPFMSMFKFETLQKKKKKGEELSLQHEEVEIITGLIKKILSEVKQNNNHPDTDKLYGQTSKESQHFSMK